MEKKTVLATATVGRPHGVEGFLRIYPLSGEYEHLLKLDEALLELKNKEKVKVTVKDVKMHQDALLMRFNEYADREKAKLLSGSLMYISRDKCPPLKKGEYYIADLYDAPLVFEGERVGTVVDTSEGAQALLLHVRTEDGRIFLVPNMKPFIEKVDMEKGEGIELAKKYKVSAYPTMLVLDAEGNVIYTLVGACDANSLVQQVRQHSDPSKGYAVCKKAYETGERTPEVVANYITVMIAAKEMTPQQGDSLANAYCQALSDQDFVAKETWMLLESCIFNPQGETFARMMKLHDALTKETEAQKVDKKIERVAFLYAIDYLRGVAGKDAVMAVLGQVKEGTYPDEYTLKLVYELLQLNDTAAVMDFFKTRVKNMKNAQDRLNMDTLIPYYMPKATDEQKKEMEKYIEETLQNCDRRAYNKYMDLYTVIKDGGYAD